jgi:hypothetical protein
MKNPQQAKRTGSTAKRPTHPRGSRSGRGTFKNVFKNYADIFQAPPHERVSAIKEGVPAVFVVTITKWERRKTGFSACCACLVPRSIAKSVKTLR